MRLLAPPPALHWSLQRPLGPPHPQPFPPAASGAPWPPAPCPAAPSAPCSSCPGCCTPRCRGDCNPRTAPGRPPAPPLAHPSGAPHHDQPARRSLPNLLRSSLSTLSPVPRAWHSGPSPALQLQPCCGARVWGRCLVPRPPLVPLLGSQPGCWAVLQHPPVPSPYPCSGPGSRAPQPQHPPPLRTELAAAAAPAPPTPTRGAEPGHCSPRPARPPRCFQSWRVRTPILGWGKRRGKYHGKGELLISETHNWILSFPAVN